MKTGVGRRMGRRAAGGDPGIWEAAGGRAGRKGGARIYWGSKSLMLRNGEQSSPGTCGGKDSTRG